MVPIHGSVNCSLLDDTEQVARFRHALDTTDTEVVAWHELWVNPTAHEPDGVP